MANNNNNGLLKGLLLGTAAIGAGIYVYRNKELRDQISTKIKSGTESLNSNTETLKLKANDFAKSAKESLDQTIKDTKISIDDGIAKTTEQFNTLSQRLTNALNAGKEAAKETIISQDKLHETINNVKSNLQEKLDFTKSKVQDVTANIQNEIPSMGATEDTTPQNNANDLHPATANVSKSIGDAGTNFDSLNKN